MKNGLSILLILLLTIYAPIELSRMIVEWGLAPEFVFELVFMWIFYGIAISIVFLTAQRRTRGRDKRRS